MNTRNIAVHTAFSALLWPVGVALVCIGLFGPHELGQLGLLCAMIAAVLNVRGFIACLDERERAAYQLGQESVRPIR